MKHDWGSFLAELKQDGWRVVVASAIGFALGVNVLPFYTLGAFVIPLGSEFGWTRAQVQGALIFLVLATLAGASLTGWLTDRYGVRRVALGSQISLTIAIVLLAMTPDQLWYWYGVWFLMTFTALGTSPITWTRAVAGWFDAARGRALALALCGSGVAAIVLPPWTVWIIGEWGWRTAYLALATLPLVIALPVTYWLLPTAAQRPSSTVAPTEPKSAEKNDFEVKEALMSYRFWLLMASTMLLGFAISGTIPNIIPLLIDIGVSAPTAAGLMGVFGISLIIGRLSAGYTLDFVWAPAVAAVMFPLAALACALLSTGVTDYAVLVMSIFLFGIATGAEFDLIPYIITRYFGLKRYGQIYALQWVGWTVFSGVAPTIYGYIFDVSGSYRGALYAAIACFLVAPVLVLFLGRYPKRDVLTPQQA